MTIVVPASPQNRIQHGSHAALRPLSEDIDLHTETGQTLGWTPALSFNSLHPPPRTYHRTHRMHRLRAIPASFSCLLLRRLVEWDAFSEKMGSEGYPSSPRSAWEQSSRAFERLSTLLREMQVRDNCITAHKCTRDCTDGADFGDVGSQESQQDAPAGAAFAVLEANVTNLYL